MFKKTIFSLLILILALPFICSADGGIMPPPDYYVREDAQKAVIVHDNNVETMILSVEFSGDANQFGWVIPTPSRPEVSKSSDELFKSLEDLTGKVYDVMPMAEEMGLGGVQEKEAVTVLETKKIDIYDIAILEASDAQALAKWLSENGFQYPTSEAYILDSYVNKNWYFTAVKVQSEFVNTSSADRLSTGHATPLKLVFQSDRIVYPLKISAIQVEKTQEKNSNSILDDERYMYDIIGDTAILKEEYIGWYNPVHNYVGITLYVLADGKKTLPAFTTDYAGWVKPSQIEKWAYVDGQPWLEVSKNYFLTKLSDSILPSEMTDDLYLRDADNNKVVGGGEELGWKNVMKEILYFFLYLIIWVISPIGIIFLIASLLQFLAKSQVAHIVAWILQILMFLFNLIFVIFFNLLGYSSTSTFEMSIGLSVASYVTLLLMIGVVVWQEVYKRKKSKLKTTSKK